MIKDPVSVLNQLGIHYQDHGHYVKFHCINPMHNDDHPSMTMLKENGFAKCWSCGATYSLFAFVGQVTGKNPFEYLNIEDTSSFKFQTTLQQQDPKKKKPGRKVKREMSVDGEFLDVFKNREALQYLRSFEVTDSTIIDFNISYMLRGEIGFLKNKKKTFIKNRICIPLHENGKTMNVECRDYTGVQKPKVIYPKGSKSDILFNYDNLNFNETIIVVEGIKSALRIYSHLNKNVTATLGASIGKGQMEELSKAKHLIVFPDSDIAGVEMLRQLDKELSINFEVVFMEEEGQDPADGTLEDLKKAIDNKVTVVDYWQNVYDVFESKKFKNLTW